VNTPPPSTSDDQGPGVTAPDGYTTDTGQMSSAGRTISTRAEDAKGEVDEVKPAKVQVAEFGVKHQQWHPDYSAAIEALGTASTAMCDNLMAFAGQLGGAGTSYDDNETGATTTVTQAGA
jgi:hypothetical protein